MELLRKIPADAAEGSLWMLFRYGGQVEYATYSKGRMYYGTRQDREVDLDKVWVSGKGLVTSTVQYYAKLETEK